MQTLPSLTRSFLFSMYVDDKHNELMLGISISFSRFALCRILPGAPADAEYVEMRNSL